jgi:diaminopimelate decarboxylase
MHIGSGADFEHLRRVCDAMVAQVRALAVDVRAISGGGGLPVPYRPGDAPFDTAALHEHWNDARRRVEELVGHPVSLEIEPGRYLVAQSGVLVARVRATKHGGANRFVVVDAGFNDLARPVMYGAYHAIEVIPQGGGAAHGPTQPSIVAGPLCESGDVFTQEEGGVVVPRDLPDAAVGDLVVIRDAGAYAASMASNYNTRPLAPEFLLERGAVRQIRRRQTIAELLALEE